MTVIGAVIVVTVGTLISVYLTQLKVEKYPLLGLVTFLATMAATIALAYGYVWAVQ